MIDSLPAMAPPHTKLEGLSAFNLTHAELATITPTQLFVGTIHAICAAEPTYFGSENNTRVGVLLLMPVYE